MIALTPLGHAVLCVPRELTDAGYVVVGVAEVTDRYAGLPAPSLFDDLLAIAGEE